MKMTRQQTICDPFKMENCQELLNQLIVFLRTLDIYFHGSFTEIQWYWVSTVHTRCANMNASNSGELSGGMARGEVCTSRGPRDPGSIPGRFQQALHVLAISARFSSVWVLLCLVRLTIPGAHPLRSRLGPLWNRSRSQYGHVFYIFQSSNLPLPLRLPFYFCAK